MREAAMVGAIREAIRPVELSGARILVTGLQQVASRHEMVPRDFGRGLATGHVGGGQGTALVVER